MATELKIGTRLRNLREKHGLTQQDVADRTSGVVYRTWISRVELSSDPKISLSNLVALADAFEIPLGDFCEYLAAQEKGVEQESLKTFLITLHEVPREVVEDVVAYYNFRREEIGKK